MAESIPFFIVLFLEFLSVFYLKINLSSLLYFGITFGRCTRTGRKKTHVLKSLQLGFLAGCGFGGFFILIAQTGDGSGMWPLLAARAASVPVFLVITLFRRRPVLLEKGSLRYAVMAGLLDMGANVFYLLATRTGFMVTAVIISSLYPAPTVLLQRIVRGEKLNFLRICGIVLAITGAALIGIS